jgi:uncharacterized protein YbaA (DUF1428 family)
MPRYVDGFVLAVPKKNIDAYRATARKAGKIWREHGALEYIEAVGDDLRVQDTASFPRQVSAKKSETVVFAYIVYKSRAHRDQVMAKVMDDPRIAKMATSAKLFDDSRMAYGGFRVIVDA